MTVRSMNTKSDIITGWRVRMYDRLMGLLGLHRSVHKKALALIDLQENEQLLDVGCGTGTFLKLARERFPNARFVGVDASEDMLAEARKAQGGLPIELVYADATHLPFPDAAFDSVLSVLTFHHLPTGVKIRAIQEISRVLKRGGKCLIVDFGRAATKWGAFQTFFLNWHSYTKGNMALVEQELARWGLCKVQQKWHRGFVELLVAKNV